MLEKLIKRIEKDIYHYKVPAKFSHKYIHFFLQNDLKFYSSLVNEINSKSSFFYPLENVFFTSHWNVYYSLRHYKNIHYIKGFTVDDINIIGKLGEWIFIHALNLKFDSILKIEKDVANKILWRTWGHDVPDLKYLISSTRNVGEIDYYNKVNDKINEFYAIGGANDVDRLNIQKKLGFSNFYIMPYSFDSIQNIFEKRYIKKNNTTNILVGHSGFKSENLIDNLQNLINYKKYDICIYLILSYGDKEYIKEVESFAKTTFGSKVQILKDFIELEKYIAFLQTIDIAIMDQIKSAALGNIEWLVYFNKKIYLNKNGIIREAFNLYGLPYGFTAEIGRISFEDLKKSVIFKSKDKFNLQYHNREENLYYWKKIMTDLLDTEKYV